MASSRDSIYLQKRETMVILDSFLQNKSQAPPGAPVSHEKTPFLPSLGLNRRGRRGKREREKLKNKKEEDRSIFGRSLEELEALSSFPVPIIVLQCISYLGKKRELEGIFRISTRQTHLMELRDRFVVPDKGGGGGGGWVDLEEATSDPHAVCALLKLYLRSLPTLVFPFSVFLKLVEVIKKREAELEKEGLHEQANEQALKEEQKKIGAGHPRLPAATTTTATTINHKAAQEMMKIMRDDHQMWKTCHISTAAAIFSFLEKIAEKSEVNLMTAANLGVPMGPCLMGVAEGKEGEYMDIMIGSFDVKIVEFLIDHHEIVFSPLMKELDTLASSSSSSSSSSPAISTPSSPPPVSPLPPSPLPAKGIPRQQAFDLNPSSSNPLRLSASAVPLPSPSRPPSSPISLSQPLSSPHSPQTPTLPTSPIPPPSPIPPTSPTSPTTTTPHRRPTSPLPPPRPSTSPFRPLSPLSSSISPPLRRSTSSAPPPLPPLPSTPLPPFLPPLPPSLPPPQKKVFKWKVLGVDPLLKEKKILPVFNIEVTIPYQPHPIKIHRSPEDILALFHNLFQEISSLSPSSPSLSSLPPPPKGLEKDGEGMEAMEKVVGEVEEFLEGVGRVVGEEGEKGGREVESFEKFLKDTNPKNGWKDSVGFEVFAVYCQLKEEGGSGGEGGEGGNKEIEGGYLCARAGGEVEVVKKGEGEGFMREELWTFHRQIFRFKSTQHIKTYHLLRSVSSSSFLFYPRLLPTLRLENEISERNCIDINTDFWKICRSNLNKSPKFIHLREGKLVVGGEICDTMFRLDKVFESVSEIKLKE